MYVRDRQIDTQCMHSDSCVNMRILHRYAVDASSARTLQPNQPRATGSIDARSRSNDVDDMEEILTHNAHAMLMCDTHM
jgi:hypothetical protein